jgi:hypothetical protein
MQHGILDQERRHLLPLVGTCQLEDDVSQLFITIDKLILTGIHGIGPQQLVGVLDGLRHVNAAVGEGIDSVPLVQVGAVSVKRQVVVLVVMPDAVKLFHEWNTGSFQNLLLADTRALEDERRAVRTRRQNDHLPGFDCTWRLLGRHEFWVRY